MKKEKRNLSFSQRRSITGFVFVLPWLIGFLWFYGKGIIQAVIFSLSTINLQPTGGYTLDFVGLDNFKYVLFTDSTFNQTLVNSVINMLIDVPLIIFFSLFMAILLNSKFKGRAVMRAILFLPIIMSSGAISSAITAAQQAITGGVSSVSSEAAVSGGINISYLMNMFSNLGFPETLSSYITAAVGRIFDIVQASGIQIIIFLAALQSVPSNLYEVAKISGATAYETFWKVTFPMVSPLIVTNVVYTIVDAFVDSDVATAAYEMAFTSFNWSVSVAMSLISSSVVCILLFIITKAISKWVFYYN